MAALNENASEMLTSLSAMFDGEASEHDIERLLQADSAELSRQLESFHLIQQTLHNESAVTLGLADNLLLRVREEIDKDDLQAKQPNISLEKKVLPFVLPEKVSSSRFNWRVMLSGVAVAASVSFVVVLGGNGLLTSDTAHTNVVAEVRTPSPNMIVTPLAQLDKDTLQADNIRLQHYLRQHAEQAAMTVGQGMIPMARVVSYPVKE
ncbi:MULTISPECIES: sigma-E factor negative regulatory protein [Marinomonas]|uniref:Sigma-E factor negative regulatory protein n=1 Tax=Marinomonas rhodophyticola TaxID=2992803 RepID=A0ABT3KLE8_9GAMM|nr:sigma-E factor negative regulatory protein [Marinomonas sp. KJ51-3]MCW4631219.1 sigma-E factor negative regulatory protein [Marinomonas sp. KJ51-3]